MYNINIILSVKQIDHNKYNMLFINIMYYNDSLTYLLGILEIAREQTDRGTQN